MSSSHERPPPPGSPPLLRIRQLPPRLDRASLKGGQSCKCSYPGAAGEAQLAPKAQPELAPSARQNGRAAELLVNGPPAAQLRGAARSPSFTFRSRLLLLVPTPLASLALMSPHALPVSVPVLPHVPLTPPVGTANAPTRQRQGRPSYSWRHPPTIVGGRHPGGLPRARSSPHPHPHSNSGGRNCKRPYPTAAGDVLLEAGAIHPP